MVTRDKRIQQQHPWLPGRARPGRHHVPFPGVSTAPLPSPTSGQACRLPHHTFWGAFSRLSSPSTPGEVITILSDKESTPLPLAPAPVPSTSPPSSVTAPAKQPKFVSDPVQKQWVERLLENPWQEQRKAIPMRCDHSLDSIPMLTLLPQVSQADKDLLVFECLNCGCIMYLPWV
jgi:hypothetical protein